MPAGPLGGGTSVSNLPTSTRASLIPFPSIIHLLFVASIRLTPVRVIVLRSSRSSSEPTSVPIHLLENNAHLAGKPFNLDIVRKWYTGSCLPMPDLEKWPSALNTANFTRGSTTSHSASSRITVQVVSIGPSAIASTKGFVQLETELDRVRDSVGKCVKHFVLSSGLRRSALPYLREPKRPSPPVSDGFLRDELATKYKLIFAAFPPLESSDDGYVFFT